MCVAYDKCGSLQVNTEELIFMLKGKFSFDLCSQKPPLNAMSNLQTNQHGAPASERLKLRY